MGYTAKFEKTPGAITSPPPRLGAHTDAVLAEVGFAPDEIRHLHDCGAV